MPQQFKNPVNAVVHRTTTGAEILAQLGRARAGRVRGRRRNGRHHHRRGPGAARAARRRGAGGRRAGEERGPLGRRARPAPHPGDRRRVRPGILDRALLSEVRRVGEDEAEATRLELARREGLLVGISAGAAVKVGARRGPRARARQDGGDGASRHRRALRERAGPRTTRLNPPVALGRRRRRLPRRSRSLTPRPRGRRLSSMGTRADVLNDPWPRLDGGRGPETGRTLLLWGQISGRRGWRSAR